MFRTSYRVGSRRRNKAPLVVAALVTAMLLGGGVIAWQITHPHSPVSNSIARQLDFSPFIPDTHSGISMSSQKYDNQNKSYSYVLTSATGQKFTVSEQASPPNFSEIPDLYTKLLDGLHQYDTLETINGTVTLAHPIQGETAAILNSKGVLMFVRADDPNQDMRSWKRIIESLEIYKLQNSL